MLNSEVLIPSQPQTRLHKFVRDTLLVLGASALIALSAQIRIPLPFTPVPISMQTFAVLFLAAMLGRKRGALAVIAYLAEGLVGLPVFIGANAGLMYFTGATGGYLVGFVAAAYVTGKLMEKRDGNERPTWLRSAIALFLGNVTIHVFGLAWLSQLLGFKTACVMGLIPFLIGDGIKYALALFGTRVFKPFRCC